MRRLLITAETRAQIQVLIAFARANPVDAIAAIEADKRDRDAYRGSMDRFTIFIPFGFAVAFTFEKQPSGLFRHIAVSIDDKGNLPDPAMVCAICEEFGMGNILDQLAGRALSSIVKGWVEELEGGHCTVNLLQLVAATEAANGVIH